MARMGKQAGGKPAMKDTGSVVNTVRGHAVLGRQRVSGNDPARNKMVSGNSGLKKR